VLSGKNMDALGIDIKLLIAQLINFILFFYIFKRFIAKPFMEYIKRERDAEMKKQNILKEAEQRLKETEEDIKSMLEDAKTQNRSILRDSQEQAEKKYKEIIEKAHKDGDIISKKITSELEIEREKLYKDVKKYIISTSIVLSSEVLKEYIDDKKQKEIIKSLTEKVSKNINYEN
jgi:F-type H+-transporting ATPase subunit b